MKYLKLFENFRDDFYKSVKDLESKYNSDREKLFSQAKSKVDQFMFDLTDDYTHQNQYQNDFIEEDDLSIWYFLKCKADDVKRFLDILSNSVEIIKDELELEVKVEVIYEYRLKASISSSDNRYLSPSKINMGEYTISNKDELNRLIDDIVDCDHFNEHDCFEFKVQIY